MKKLEYTVSFITPAFLGNAEQSGQWRTPPFKALIRQWWRVVYAADRGFAVNVDAMRQEEGRLFGVAADGEGDSRKSRIRIRLDKWAEGSLKKAEWPSLATVNHPEVRQAVASDLYLGYGPVTLRGAQHPTLKANAAIQAGDFATLSIAVPNEHAPRLERALWLMDRYGTLGGRSRNGWGSFVLLPSPVGRGAGGEGALPLRPWRDCLDRDWDWPHAIGQDEKAPLIWQTAPHTDWKALMKTLAILKIGLRTQFIFNSGNNAPSPEARHWVSHPVTKHNVKPWKQGRLPNSLRFKVRAASENPNKLVGVIFHVPCLPPPDFQPDKQAIENVWRCVHAFLDTQAHSLTRIKE